MPGTRKAPVTVEPSRWVIGPDVLVEPFRDRLQPAPCTIWPADGCAAAGS